MVPEEVKSIRIIANNICYGTEHDANDEVEQYLTISASGRVWFSARNYRQFCDWNNYCRKKQVSIGKWKADFLLRLILNMQLKPVFVTDVVSYRIEISYKNGRKEEIHGDLIGDVFSHTYGNEADVDLTRVI